MLILPSRRKLLTGAAAFAAYSALPKGDAEAQLTLTGAGKGPAGAPANPWALVDFDAAGGSSGGTTKAFNTTAVDLILAWTTGISASVVPSDSVNGGWNSGWIVLGNIANSFVNGTLWAAIPGITTPFSAGSSQTFSVSDSASSISIATFTTTGSTSTIAVDQSSNNASASTSPIAMSAITPTTTNQLIIGMAATDDTPSGFSADSGMTTLGATSLGTAITAALFWKFQTAAAAIGPQISFTPGSVAKCIGQVCSIKS